MVRHCAVRGCYEDNRTKGRRFFSFPYESRRFKQWTTAIGRKDLERKDITKIHKYYYVCDLHFAASAIQNFRLKQNGVPTLLLPDATQPDETFDSKTVCLSKSTQTGKMQIEVFTQTEQAEQPTCSSCKSEISIKQEVPSTSECDSESESENTHRKRKLLEVKSECKRRKSLEWEIEISAAGKETSPSPSLQTSIATQNSAVPEVETASSPLVQKDIGIQNSAGAEEEMALSLLLQKNIAMQNLINHKPLGNRYNDQEFIMRALNVYFTSRATYRLLSETLNFPSIETLQRHLVDYIGTKFEDAINCLKTKISHLSESDKYCIICADEISLVKNLEPVIINDKIIGFHETNKTKNKTTQVLVVLARGVMSNWNQPLAYCFLGQNRNHAELEKWVENIIATMIEIGYNVLALTSDQGPIFINMANKKSITTEQPFFYVNGKKIHYIFDVPHLVKALRNNLMKYDFVYHDADGNEIVACWDDIKTLYETEKSKSYKLAYRLTESHISPDKLQKTQVKFAAQVLSRTVAVAIYTLVETGTLPQKSYGTAQFVELINDAFDVLNSSMVDNDYKYKNAFYQADYQINTLNKLQQVLSGLRVINRKNRKDVTSTVKCIEGLLISIKAILSLATDLNSKGYDYLFTRRLNQEALENIFEKVRQQGGSCELSASQFYAAFRELFIVNMMQRAEHANCSEDSDRLPASAKETRISLTSGSGNKESIPREASRTGTHNCRFDLHEENAFTYFCGYLLKKCRDLHRDCEIMENYTNKNEQVDEKNLFLYLKANEADKPFGSLINPPEDFKEYIRQIDSICENNLVNSEVQHVGNENENEIVAKINEITFDAPCACFPLEYLKKLFLSFRIRGQYKLWEKKSEENI